MFGAARLQVKALLLTECNLPLMASLFFIPSMAGHLTILPTLCKSLARLVILLFLLLVAQWLWRQWEYSLVKTQRILLSLRFYPILATKRVVLYLAWKASQTYQVMLVQTQLLTPQNNLLAVVVRVLMLPNYYLAVGCYPEAGALMALTAQTLKKVISTPVEKATTS